SWVRKLFMFSTLILCTCYFIRETSSLHLYRKAGQDQRLLLQFPDNKMRHHTNTIIIIIIIIIVIVIVIVVIRCRRPRQRSRLPDKPLKRQVSRKRQL
ncbi:MAG: hypothetical protein LBR80_18535, partial [Deltaproteobacteria bacterium]|nr:hypothetical protein [Deltaproteobacteria bacterium]